MGRPSTTITASTATVLGGVAATVRRSLILTFSAPRPTDISLRASSSGGPIEVCRRLAPRDSSWSEEFFYVCFNDACSYYKEGWDWMEKHFKHKASYRCMINPTTGAASPLPVWSASATREMIVEDAEGGDE